MENHQNINDEITSLKLMILQNNLKQNWNLDSEVWNEEFPYDYRFEDTYLQLSFILRDFNVEELNDLCLVTNVFNINKFNHTISTLINNYIKSCVDYLNHEIDGKTEEYFMEFNKNNNCFSYEKKIKKELVKSIKKYAMFFYGTLRAIEVREAVLGKDIDKHKSNKAIIYKHQVYKVMNVNYPLITYTNNSQDKVEGLLVHNISEEELKKLDAFEGKNYFRAKAQVEVHGQLFNVEIYMPDKTMGLDQIWDFDDWYKNNMEDFFKKEFNINGVGTS
tara:strand:- start:3946 stop:4773 length:828 start_codon:yes stop_codon:yes gene_type:complete